MRCWLRRSAIPNPSRLTRNLSRSATFRPISSAKVGLATRDPCRNARPKSKAFVHLPAVSGSLDDAGQIGSTKSFPIASDCDWQQVGPLSCTSGAGPTADGWRQSAAGRGRARRKNEFSKSSPSERTPLRGRRQSASSLGQLRVRPKSPCLQATVVLALRCRALCG